MPFTTITTALREPLSTIYTICNEPSTPQYGGFRNHLKYNTLARQCLVNFIKSHDWVRTATYIKLFAEIGLYASNFIIR